MFYSSSVSQEKKLFLLTCCVGLNLVRHIFVGIDCLFSCTELLCKAHSVWSQRIYLFLSFELSHKGLQIPTKFHFLVQKMTFIWHILVEKTAQEKTSGKGVWLSNIFGRWLNRHSWERNWIKNVGSWLQHSFLPSKGKYFWLFSKCPSILSFTILPTLDFRVRAFPSGRAKIGWHSG